MSSDQHQRFSECPGLICKGQMPCQGHEPYSKPQGSLAATKAFSLHMSEAALQSHGPHASFPGRLGQVPNAKEDHFPWDSQGGSEEWLFLFFISGRNCLCRGPPTLWKPDLLCINPTIMAPHCPYFMDSLPPPSAFPSIIHSLKIHLTINSTRRRMPQNPDC